MTKEGAEFFNVKITDLKDGDFYSSGIAGNVNITGMSCISVALHDLQFPPIACRIIHGTSPDYFVTLGSDFLHANKLIVNCANKSIGRQIAPDVYRELIVDLGKSSCRRRIVNLPIYLQNDLTTSKGNETITDFNIVLPDVKIVKNFSCACENETINKLNNFIYFSANNQTIDENLDDMLIDDVMTNIYYPQVSISNPSLELDVTLPRGTIIGKVTSPLCKVNDAEIPLRLNKNLETSDFDLHNQLHVEKFNKIKNNLNSNLIKNKNNILNNNLSTSNTEILNDDTLGEINCLKNIEILYSVYHEINSQEARYDFSPPEKGEYNREDEDLPSFDYWTRETLNESSNVQSDNDIEKKEVQDLLYEFKEVFSEGEFFSAATLPELTVELTDEVPVFVPQFKLSPPLEQAVQEQIDELIKHKKGNGGGITKDSSGLVTFHGNGELGV
ncbi:unnamed protein product [Rotaria magnacalcarata]|uniref:Uncharacterized protein n=1 Tax=Rotaria magnacalcarata TaxID=392030 RepID=A0A820KIZ8_9BILA|nr:unnamed protein product [Rotaria magnacalcarata]